jgi:SEC-C motif
VDPNATDLCGCGSGRPFARCHGDPHNAEARAEALREAESIAWMFPSVRPAGQEVEAFVDTKALEHPTDDVPDFVLGEGLELVDERERRRIVELWSDPYADRWASLTHATGDAEAAERALVVGSLRAAIAERQSTPRELVEPLERGALRRSPFAALSTVLPPALVWSVDEARAGQVAASERRGSARMDAVEGVAYALMTFTHIQRTSALTRRLGLELPFQGLPEASRTLATACDDVTRSLDAARAVAAAMLVAYVERLGPRS